MRAPAPFARRSGQGEHILFIYEQMEQIGRFSHSRTSLHSSVQGGFSFHPSSIPAAKTDG